MRKTIMLAVAALSVFGAPAVAQQSDAVIIVYGSDRCPAQFTCERRPEGERYRIPKELRTPIEITPENKSWAAKANDTLSAGASVGPGSCSSVGPGGWTGCWAQQMRAAKAERRANAATDRATP